jgi:hypothetical protein
MIVLLAPFDLRQANARIDTGRGFTRDRRADRSSGLVTLHRPRHAANVRIGAVEHDLAGSLYPARFQRIGIFLRLNGNPARQARAQVA